MAFTPEDLPPWTAWVPYLSAVAALFGYVWNVGKWGVTWWKRRPRPQVVTPPTLRLRLTTFAPTVTVTQHR